METLVNQKEIIKLFIKAIENKDIQSFQYLLDDSGVFEIQLPDLSDKDVSKNEFIAWFSNKLSTTEIESIKQDKCLFCKIGNPVVILNNGLFPRKCADISERTTIGLMLDIKGGKIIQIQFCTSFLHTDNKYQFEEDCEVIKKLMNEGLNLSEAYLKMKGQKTK
jgi:hypothetical protein